LTNAMLLKGKRMERLLEINHDNLTIQVSLDGGRADHHDAYRGKGSWARTVEGIRNLQQNGFKVRLSTTETPANAAYMDELCQFHLSLGIPEDQHFIRPLAKRGFSADGLDVSRENLLPELTANLDGIFWHPLTTDEDMRVSEKLFPLADAVETVRAQISSSPEIAPPLQKTFT